MKVISKIPFILLLLLAQLLPGGAVSAFSVGDVAVSPPGYVYPGDPVNVSFTIDVASGTAFSLYDDLQLATDLQDPRWTYSITVNGAKNSRPISGDRTIAVSGFELGYRPQDEVTMDVLLQGRIPSDAATGANRSLTRVQEIDARGYSIASSVVDISHLIGEPTPTPTPEYGSISVNSSPPGADIYIDNVYKGLAPATFTEISNGNHVILVRAEGYSDWTRRVTVSGDLLSLAADLDQKNSVPLSSAAATPPQNARNTTAGPVQGAGFGSLSITTTPPGALIYIDGTMMGVTPATIPMLPEGPHTVTLIRDGYQDLRTSITVNAGTTSEYITGLPRTTQSPGFSAGIATIALAVFLMFRRRRDG